MSRNASDVTAFKILAVNVPALVCFSAAVYLITQGYEHGWGWLILIGAMTVHTFSGSKEKQELKEIVEDIPLLTSVVEKDGKFHTRCEYCGNVIDNGRCGEALNRDYSVTVTGHMTSCVYKRALRATDRRF